MGQGALQQARTLGPGHSSLGVLARECPMAWPGWGQTQARWAERGEKTAGPGGEEGLQHSVCGAEL